MISGREKKSVCVCVKISIDTVIQIHVVLMFKKLNMWYRPWDQLFFSVLY